MNFRNSLNHKKSKKVQSHGTDKTFPVVVIGNIFLLPWPRHQFPLTTLNEYLPRGSNGKFFLTISFGNVFIARNEISTAIILLLGFV